MRLHWTKRAISDLSEARFYVARDNPAAATKLAARIIKATERLKENPNMGRKCRLRGTGELVIPNTPYFIPYRILAGRVELLRVYHGARLYPPKV